MKIKFHLLLSVAILITIISAFNQQQPKRGLFKKRHPAADIFGIKEIYPTVSHGEEWYMDMKNPVTDRRFSPGRPITQNSDGSWKMQNIQVRMGVYTSTGWSTAKIDTYDQAKLSARGYMQAPNDWKNIEMTAYVKLNSFTSSTTNGAAHFEFEARGGTHTGGALTCQGTAYHSNFYETGRSKFEKELEHTAGYTKGDPEIPNVCAKLDGRWIGVKAVYYNLKNGSVRLEKWIDDKADNNWKLVHSYVDDGNWGGGKPNCNGSDKTIITWGGPIATFRWDNLSDVDFKNLSVREIKPPK
jgi:hypothetical protein